MALTIDAHQHFWQLSLPFNYAWLDVPQHAPIRRDFLPEHLEPHLRAAGVDRTIFVQTQHNLDETRWVLGLAERHKFIAGVVGWVDLASEMCEEQLLELKAHPKFVGVRHVTQDEPEDFIVRPDIIRGLRVLEKHDVPFDLLFYVKHLRHVPALARQLPSLRMVIDHLAKPQIRERRMDDWLPHFRAAAAFPNVYCKLSGMVTEADWQAWRPADLKPYVQTALEAFGPQRCLFGSDWPVCELAAPYEQVNSALVEALGPISEAERAMIFGDTARRFYRLFC
ncbi:MAG TPA: amidohydrolase family protein [Gemmataceae bacterium]|nr:amidohydrolase family protein [Gemmataceae bacterium]